MKHTLCEKSVEIPGPTEDDFQELPLMVAQVSDLFKRIQNNSIFTIWLQINKAKIRMHKNNF